MLLKRNRTLKLFAKPLAAAAVLLLAGVAQSAHADVIDPVNPVIAGPTPFSSLPSASFVNGKYTVETLTILPGGSITNDDPVYPTGSSAGNINIVVHTAMTMLSGSSITAENRYGSGSGGNISITVGAPGNGAAFFMQSGSLISSRKKAGSGSTGHSGDIYISAPTVFTGMGSAITAGQSLVTDRGPAGSVAIEGEAINIDGEVSARSGMTSDCWYYQGQGGGPISIDATIAAFLGPDSVISSRGLDPGADLVHIEAMAVSISGLVESTGDGSSLPYYATLVGPCNRSGKPSNSTGGIEVWGYVVAIDNILHSDFGTFHAELNADMGISGGTGGRGWIDVFADNEAEVSGVLPVPPLTGRFTIHANGGLAQNNDDGGIVTVKSASGDVRASGLAIQADSTNSGGIGGQITIEAKTDLLLDTAALSALGDFTATSYSGCGNGWNNYGFSCNCYTGGGGSGCYGGYGKGGQINLVTYTGSILWTNGLGDVRPTGTGVPASQRGIITLKYGTGTAASNVVLTNTQFPAIGTATTPSGATHVTTTAPVIPSYVNLHKP